MNPKVNVHIGNVLIHLGKDIEFINGKLSNGRILRGSTKPAFASIVFDVETMADQEGSIILDLPRWLLDAKKGNEDEDFIAFVDGKEVEVQEKSENEEMRIVEINIPAGSNTLELIGTRAARKSPKGEPDIELDKDLIGPLSQFIVTVNDSLAVKNANERGSVIVYVRTDDSDQEIEIELIETEVNSGMFQAVLRLTPNKQRFSGDLEVKSGTLVSIRYEGQQYDKTGKLTSVTVSQIIEVKTFDPEFVFDKDNYTVGDHVLITISDPDRDVHSTKKDVIQVRIGSTSDKKGLTMNLVETGLSTGVFKGTFRLLSTTNHSLNSLKVAEGDQITVHYLDPFPADYEGSASGTDSEFTFSTNVGVRRTKMQKVILSMPRIVDVRGTEINRISQGQLVVVASHLENAEPREMRFALLLEVRDTDDHTVHISWTEGSISAGGSTEVGLSWKPEASGQFSIRTVVLTNISNPIQLSPMQIIDIHVQ